MKTSTSFALAGLAVLAATGCMDAAPTDGDETSDDVATDDQPAESTQYDEIVAR